MSFTWKCDKCSLSSLQCYEGNCAFDRMKKDTTDVIERVINGPDHDEDLREELESCLKSVHDQLDKFIATFEKSNNEKVKNTKGQAVKRYIDRAVKNVLKHPATVDNYNEHFTAFLVKLFEKVCSGNFSTMSMFINMNLEKMSRPE